VTRKKDPEYEIGSGNVFADLELDDADELLTRAQLGHTVRLLVRQRKLKQREIATLLDIDQAEVSRLMNGQYHLFAEGRLFAFLKCLEQKVTIQVSRHHKGEPYQQVTFASSRRRDPRASALPAQGTILDDLR
jgi:predicted XRE-type DNA-binding protein